MVFPRLDAPRVGRVSVEEEAAQTDACDGTIGTTLSKINFTSLATWNLFPRVLIDFLIYPHYQDESPRGPMDQYIRSHRLIKSSSSFNSKAGTSLGVDGGFSPGDDPGDDP